MSLMDFEGLTKLVGLIGFGRGLVRGRGDLALNVLFDSSFTSHALIVLSFLSFFPSFFLIISYSFSLLRTYVLFLLRFSLLSDWLCFSLLGFVPQPTFHIITCGWSKRGLDNR